MRILILFILPCFVYSQHNSIPLNSDLHHFANRLEIQGKSSIHTAINEYSSRTLFHETIDTFNTLSEIDQYLAAKLIRTYPEFWDNISFDNTLKKEFIDTSNLFYTTHATSKNELSEIVEPKKPILKYFYQNRNYFRQISAKGFLLKVNPVVFFGIGRDLSQDLYTFENRRGIELSGHINHKVFFYSDILESQAAFPTYINNFENQYKALPGNGLYKNYVSSLSESITGFDFLNAKALVNARITKGINVEFGNGKHFIGNGNRSLLQSDFTNNNLYLKFSTRIWKLHYQNVFSELIPISTKDNPAGTLIPRKYTATHYLSYKHRNIELGVFESVVFQRDGKFDFQYLNPVILYRLVEYNLDSSDNVLVGANAKWNLAQRVQLYGQFLFDEFKLDELFILNRGWWANKYALQAGAKYIDVLGISNLDLELEYNRIRPFTYGHGSIANYAHSNQALAHPLGANISEISISANYYVNPKLKLSSTNYLIRQGLDSDSTYYGANILISSSDRESNIGFSQLSGEASQTFLSVNNVSYELLPNYFLDFKIIYRSQKSDISDLNFKNFIMSGGIRINFWEPKIHI